MGSRSGSGHGGQGPSCDQRCSFRPPLTDRHRLTSLENQNKDDYEFRAKLKDSDFW